MNDAAAAAIQMEANANNRPDRSVGYLDLRSAASNPSFTTVSADDSLGELRSRRRNWKRTLESRYGIPLTTAREEWESLRRDPKGFLAHKGLNKLKENWRAALTLILVTLPSAITIAVASGATPVAGLASLVYGGLIGSSLGGSSFNIYGPTSSTAFVTRDLISSNPLVGQDSSTDSSGSGFVGGSENSSSTTVQEPRIVASDMAAQLTFASGVIIFALFYLLRVHKLVAFIPSAVAEGFKQAVGIVLILSQLKPGFGLLELPRQDDFYMGIVLVFSHLERANLLSVLVFVTSSVILVVFPKRWPSIPWIPVVLTISIALSALLNRNGYLPTLYSQYGDLPRRTARPYNPFSPDHLPIFISRDFWLAAFSIALTATLETILSARTAERLNRKQLLNQPREVLALGTANIAVGLLGGIIASGGVARTVLAVKSGATSRIAGILSALGVNLISLLILPFFEHAPLALLAASSLSVGWKMIDPSEFVRLYRFDRTGLFLALVTITVYIFIGPAMALFIPSLLALLIFTRYLRQGHGDILLGQSNLQLTDEEERGNKPSEKLMTDGQSKTSYQPFRSCSLSLRNFDKLGKASNGSFQGMISWIPNSLVYGITGEMNYINRFAHVERIRRINLPYLSIIFSLRHCLYLDIDGVDALGEVIADLKQENKIVAISSIREPIRKILQKSSWYLQLFSEGMVFHSDQAAINACGALQLARLRRLREEQIDRDDYEDIRTGYDDSDEHPLHHRIDVYVPPEATDITSRTQPTVSTSSPAVTRR